MSGNVYVIRVLLKGEKLGFLTMDDTPSHDKNKAMHFSTLLAADSYACVMDMEFPTFTHNVEVL